MAISGANVHDGKCPASVRIMTLIAHARKNAWSSAEVKCRTSHVSDVALMLSSI